MRNGVTFYFSSGWCKLTLGSGGERQAFLATALTDAFGQIAQAVAALARTESDPLVEAVLWGDEPGGVFLDFATAVPNQLALVVHELAMRGWITDSDWMPVRGNVLFTALAPRRELVTDFLHAFIEIERSVTADGTIQGWPHPFPAEAVKVLRNALSI